MIRRPPRSTQGVSSAASDVYKRQYQRRVHGICYLDFESDEPEDSWTTIETALDESWGLVSAVYYSPTPKTKKILIFGGMMKAQVYSLNLESQKIEEESSLFLPFVTGTLIRNSCKTLPNGVYGISKESCSLALLQNGVWKQYSQREWAQTDLVYDATSAIPQIHLHNNTCLLYTSPSPRDLSTSRMPSSA
eukprot:TRINITY_DN10824_c0_g1_i4.p2 TRINITY_DN10824_c0_g1~~TRINITY_DN10824_c0_g1_i4.p2  ORF type:complete len:191 (+),score=39.76 TRINITY_DN10824_c0_g1_i4:117-689(+)